jgi:hypothetical protein
MGQNSHCASSIASPLLSALKYIFTTQKTITQFLTFHPTQIQSENGYLLALKQNHNVRS